MTDVIARSIDPITRSRAAGDAREAEQRPLVGPLSIDVADAVDVVAGRVNETNAHLVRIERHLSSISGSLQSLANRLGG